MSAAVGAVSSSTKEVSFNTHLEEELKNKGVNSDGANTDHTEETETEDDDDSKLETDRELDLGPQFSLKEQLEKDKVRFFSMCLFQALVFKVPFSLMKGIQ